MPMPQRDAPPSTGAGAVAAALRAAGWTGTIGLEGWAATDTDTALRRFRDAFSVLAPAA